MKLILEANPHLDVNLQGGDFGSPLHAAAIQTNSRCLKMLLEKGARADVVTGEHGTVLQAAAFAGCNRNVKILIEHGVDVNTVSGKHGTALQGKFWLYEMHVRYTLTPYFHLCSRGSQM
jgi:ankyrin repeat protein